MYSPIHDGVQLKISYYSDSYIIKSSDNYFLVLNVFTEGIKWFISMKTIVSKVPWDGDKLFPGKIQLFLGVIVCVGEGSCPTLITMETNTNPHFQRKCFRNVTLINIRGLAEIIVPIRAYGRHSPKQVMIKRERLTDEVLLSFS